MTKSGLAPYGEATTRSKKRVVALATKTILLAGCLSYAWYADFTSARSVLATWLGIRIRLADNEIDTAFGLNPDDKPWSQIMPERKLVYHPCFDGMQCARLLLPMDWNNNKPTSTSVAIAVLRVPAKVEVSDTRYGGTVFFNPGGPGGSGVEDARAYGRGIQDTIDSLQSPDLTQHSPSQDKYFDIIGFDPRGVMHSTPRIECFQSSFTRLVWRLQSLGELLGGPDTSLEARWSRYESLSKACMRRISREGDRNIAYHINTTPVARDLIELNERQGEWREAHVREWLSSPAGIRFTRHQRRSHSFHKQQVLERTRWHVGKEMLQYWGESYGTKLGQYVATAYPEKMHRTIFDSSNLANASERIGFPARSLQDADDIFANFCHACHHAGPEKCSIYRSTASEVCDAVDEVLTRLYERPLAVPSSEQRGPVVVTYADLKRFFGRALYQPFTTFPQAADFIRNLLQDNGTSFADWKSSSSGLNFADAIKWAPSQKCLESGSFSPACQNVAQWQDEVQSAIYCTDHEGALNLDKAGFIEFWTSMRETSKVEGDIFAEYLLKCIGWNVRAKWRQTGPFSSKTEHPILFVNNLLDPVCPLEHANIASGRFPGSAVLIQNAMGHVTRTLTSRCRSEIIRNYFQTGELPANGTICEVEERLFDAPETFNVVMEEDLVM